jgi:F0F1-type ATP synthase membrane subunit b/b'
MADLDSKVDKLEELTDANTVISIGGYSFTPAKLMIAGTIVTTILGGLYGAFEVYKDYMDMKEAITTYVAPDLSEINKRLEVLDKEMAATKETVNQATEYTNNIKNDLKADVRRVEGVVDSVERSAKQSQRETDISVKEVQSELRQTRKELDVAIKETNANVDKKIQRALDNPLANK